MRERFASLVRGSAAVALLVVASACTDDNGPEGPFCRARPAFRVWLTAFDGGVPQGTKITVQYGAGTEGYELGGQNPPSRALFCSPSARDGGQMVDDASADAADAGPQEPDAVLCDLYTEGAATISVVAEGYAPIAEELQAKRDECGIATRDVPLKLQAADAAP